MIAEDKVDLNGQVFVRSYVERKTMCLGGQYVGKCLLMTPSQYMTEINLGKIQIRDVRGVPTLIRARPDGLPSSEYVYAVEWVPGTQYQEVELVVNHELCVAEQYMNEADDFYKDQAMDTERFPNVEGLIPICLLYTSPSPRDGLLSRMPSSA